MVPLAGLIPRDAGIKVVNHHTQSAVRFLKLQAQILDTLLSVKGHVKCLRPT